jgi:hypothetical protein
MMRGRKHSPATLEKMRLASIERLKNPEFRAAQLAQLAKARANSRVLGRGRVKGSKHSPETIEKIRQASIAMWQKPGHRERHLPRLLAAQVKAKKAASARAFLPPKGTPERAHYVKVRRYLGAEAARATL